MKICIISHYDVLRKDTGGSVRTYNIAKALAENNHNVNIVVPSKKDSLGSVDCIPIKGIKGLFPYSVLKFFSVLLGVSRAASLYLYDLTFLLRSFKTISKCDIVQIDTPVPAGAFLVLFITKFFRKRVVVDSHDVFQCLRLGDSNSLRRVIDFVMENVSYKCSELILTVSEQDKALLVKHGLSSDKIFVIPNGVDTKVYNPHVKPEGIESKYSLENYSVVAFVGNMEYAPNQEAIHEIATKIVPNVSSKINNVKFLVIGRKPPKPPLVSSLVFTGVVPSVAQLLAVSDVAIAPLLHGSGTRLKILEYFSCGLPVVSTSVGVEGLDVSNEVELLIEDDLNEFSERIVELLLNKELRRKLGSAGRDLVVKEYDWDNIGKKLSGLYSTK